MVGSKGDLYSYSLLRQELRKLRGEEGAGYLKFEGVLVKRDAPNKACCCMGTNTHTSLGFSPDEGVRFGCCGLGQWVACGVSKRGSLRRWSLEHWIRGR